MDLKIFFKDFNASKFTLFSCLLPFSILLSLHINGDINVSIWTVFTPLWVLNLIVIFGAIIGSVFWCRHPRNRRDRESYTEYKALLLTASLHVSLFMFESLVCYKLHNNINALKWIVVFAPLYLTAPIAIAACVWGFKNNRSLELEGVLSSNILLFIFVQLKLDGFIWWQWTAVFIPLWIVMCLPCVAVLYYFAWAVILCRSSYHQQKQSHLFVAFNWICIVVPLLFFQVLLAYKLDELRITSSSYSWDQVFFPLHVSIFAFIISSFGSKGGNKWWFGIRSEFCPFLLNCLPFLTVYGNVSYSFDQSKHDKHDLHEVSTNQEQYAHLYGSSKKYKQVKVEKVVQAQGGNGGREKFNQIDTPD